MTYEEAIEILNEERDYAQFPEYVKEAIEIATSAIKKQIPKKCVIEKDKVLFGIVCGRCPKCDAAVYSTANLYCHKCGQALDWSDKE